MKSKDIIRLAKSIKKEWGADPIEIAHRLGIVVLDEWETSLTDFTAQTLKIGNLPTIISINKNYSDFAKKLLCAHELGHAILHEDMAVNHFTDANTQTEAEANLFALTLIGDENLEDSLCMPLIDMDGSMLKAIMDYNIQKY